LGYSLLATKPANNMTYDGRALVARPLTAAVQNSRLVIAVHSRSLSGLAVEFADHCRALFGINSAHPEGHSKSAAGQFAPGHSQS
jgi:hypothetical protein